MKLATYRDGSRDGQLVVVSRDLSQACYANGIATRLQQVLDDWNFMAPQLELLSQQLNQGRARHAFAFDPKQCAAPLPRLAGWLAGEAYPDQGKALRERGLQIPIVVMTAAHDAKMWAEEISADAFIPKPFELFDLLHQLQHVGFHGADRLFGHVDFADGGGILALVGGLHQVAFELVQLLLFGVQFFLQVPSSRLCVVTLAFQV